MRYDPADEGLTMRDAPVVSIGVCVLLAGRWVLAQDPLLPNPLADLPSAPGATITDINALTDNQWLNLGAPAPDPTWGVARGRSWGGHSLVRIPHLRGAFFTGEGVHAFVKPDGYGMDDYWLYDINAHAWICLYPGTNTVAFNQQVQDGDIAVDALGRPVSSSGLPVPGHLLIHSWKQLTYDAVLGKVVIFRFGTGFGRYYMPGGDDVETGIALMEGQGLGAVDVDLGPWAYDTATGTFELAEAVNSCPNHANDYGPFEYIDSLGEYMVTDRLGTSFFDPSTRTWSAQEPPAPGLDNDYDFCAVYEPTRDRLYMGNSDANLRWYDVQTSTWFTIDVPDTYGALSFGPNRGAITYDAANDMVLIWVFDSTNTVFPLDPDDHTFDTPIPFDSTFSSSRQETNACFYDPDLGAHFIHTAGDSRDDGEMWVFKYRRSDVPDVTPPAAPTGLQVR